MRMWSFTQVKSWVINTSLWEQCCRRGYGRSQDTDLSATEIAKDMEIKLNNLRIQRHDTSTIKIVSVVLHKKENKRKEGSVYLRTREQ